MEILTDNNPILHTKSDTVTTFDNHLMPICDQMLATMEDNNGIGLAANQVGILKRIIVVGFEPYYLINPTIISYSGTQQEIKEGCLSVPNEQVTNKRHDVITVMYQDTNGVYNSLVVDKLKSVVIQHEIDHLDGVLFNTK